MINIRTIKIVKFLDVVNATDAEGYDAEIWDEISEHRYGNQKFTNNSIFCYVLPSINGEPLSPVQQRIKQICWAAMEDEDTIYFNVSW